MTATESQPDARRLTLIFASLFTLAHIGAFAACLPLLAILVPLKAQQISPDSEASLLSWTALVGAGVASIVNIASGALSDRTRSRFGRRRPWILGGAIATIASYFAIWRAATPAELIAAIALFQVGFNIFLPALVALLPDEVPDERKGRMASLMALGPPVGLGLGAALVGSEALTAGGRYVALAGLAICLTAPLLIFWRARSATDVEGAHNVGIEGALAAPEMNVLPPPGPRQLQNFRLVWLSRLLTQLGVATSQGFLLLLVVNAVEKGADFPSDSAQLIVSRLFLASTGVSVAVALAIGALSDQVGSRQLFVAASGALIGAGMAVIAALPVWWGVFFGQIVYGIGVGLYSSAEVALAAEMLPSRRDSARDLGILNLGNTLPQALAPLLALFLIDPSGDGFSALFAVGAASAGVGGAVALRIKNKA